jgi:uncharacterized protein with HEPN domain
MKDRPYGLFLEDIKGSIQKVQKYIEGVSFEAFQDDNLTVDAVLRNLEIIVAASRTVPP